jgi:DNA polymerase I
MAINAPIQGTEADIIKLAMIKVNDYLVEENLLDKVHLLLQVHDELVFEIEDSLVEKVSPKIRAIMEKVVDLEKTKGVICKVEYKVGDNWGEMEKN